MFITNIECHVVLSFYDAFWLCEELLWQLLNTALGKTFDKSSLKQDEQNHQWGNDQ